MEIPCRTRTLCTFQYSDLKKNSRRSETCPWRVINLTVQNQNDIHSLLGDRPFQVGLQPATGENSWEKISFCSDLPESLALDLKLDPDWDCTTEIYLLTGHFYIFRALSRTFCFILPNCRISRVNECFGVCFGFLFFFFFFCLIL